MYISFTDIGSAPSSPSSFISMVTFHFVDWRTRKQKINITHSSSRIRPVLPTSPRRQTSEVRWFMETTINCDRRSHYSRRAMNIIYTNWYFRDHMIVYTWVKRSTFMIFVPIHFPYSWAPTSELAGRLWGDVKVTLVVIINRVGTVLSIPLLSYSYIPLWFLFRILKSSIVI